MIGRLRGAVAGIRGDKVLLDVHGIGYELSMTPKSIAGLPGTAETATVFTHLVVREDGMSLYGFAAEEDRDLFRILLGASGVGPRMALAILATFSADALRTVVAGEDVDALSSVPGIGKRTAQKIVLDLKPKLADLEADVMEGSSVSAQLRQALEGLGYSAAEIRHVLPSVDTSQPLGEQVKAALRELGRSR